MTQIYPITSSREALADLNWTNIFLNNPYILNPIMLQCSSEQKGIKGTFYGEKAWPLASISLEN